MLRAAVLASTVVGLAPVSTLAPAGQLDVDDVKAVARAGGARNVGAFVSEGSRLHEGTLEECLPNVP